MTHLDLSPAPGAAPRAAMLRSQTAMELKLLLRNGEQVLLTIVIPLILLIAGTRSNRIVDLGSGRPIDIITPGVLALAVLSTSFTSLAIATGFERRYGVLKRLGASPLPRSGLVIGKIAAVVLVEIAQLALLSVVALLLGWQPASGLLPWLWLALLAVFGTAAFGSLALLIAGTLRAEATLALANLVYVVLLVAGALLVPLDRYPDAAQSLLRVLPSAALGEGLRDTFAAGAPHWSAVAVLAGWTTVAGVLTARSFTWE
ncbi:ABC transporter permease [uncultured Aeromicrobium sp.]|uniref:ABC transporter permease n=1 Tax=uncultured Aeromicrobium sp. TaxID=337820 RepID=UPI0025D45E3A|nr:ABC transporter permease [uncultured Aeromicrobium sp.]